MAIFSEGLKAQYPGLEYTSIEEMVERAMHARVEVLPAAAGPTPVALIPYKARDLLQVALRRNIELGRAFVDAFNAELFIPLFVLGRSLLETGALALDLWDRVEAIGNGKTKAADGLAALDEHLMKVLLGSKTDITPGSKLYEAVNVLTLIDRLAKKRIPELRAYFDGLSEFAHPNFHGMVAAYRALGLPDQESHYIDRPFHKQSKMFAVPLNALGTGLALTVIAAESYELAFAAFVRLCEADAYEHGMWPPNLPYPRS